MLAIVTGNSKAAAYLFTQAPPNGKPDLTGKNITVPPPETTHWAPFNKGL
jgi:hypothetical protein